MAEMTSLERSLCAIEGRRPDRVPAIPQAHVWTQYYYGSSSNECMWDGEKYAMLQLDAQREFGWDGIFVATDSVALAQSLGLGVFYTDMGAAPGPIGIFDSLEMLSEIVPPDPRSTRLNEWLKATEHLMSAVGDRVLVIARADAGPFSLAAQLRGMEAFMLDVGMEEQPELIHRFLEFCLDYVISFADLLLDTGAPVVTIGDALASASLISPKTFARYAFPYQQRLAQHVHARGGRLSIHVCGYTTPIFDQLVATEADILEFDDNTDFATAVELARGKTCLLGNVAVSEVMTQGTPQMVRDACRRRLELVKPESGYILSSGCALSANAPAENLHALMNAAQEFGSY